MKKTVITLMALAAAALVNTSALAQHTLEYNPYAKDAETVSAVEQQWADAILKRDTTALSSILRDDYSLVATDGKTYNKAWELGMVQSPDFALESLSVQIGKVRVYQGGAVVTGTAVVKGKFKDADLSGQYRFTDIFEPRNNAWQAVARQLTKVEEEGKEKGKAK